MKLSVLIPTRDRWNLVISQTRCLIEVLKRHDFDFEVIVHDNCSTGVDEAARARLPPEARYVRAEQSYDTAEENICAGLTRCRGEYVWLLADDDGVEPNGVAELVRRVRSGEDDILFFNSRHGRDDRLIGDEPPRLGEQGRSFAMDDYVAGEGAFVSQRARRLFYAAEWRLPIAAYAQKTGVGYWLCAMSSIVVRREIADPAVLLKYLSIARIYAHGAWLLEIGRGRRFCFVNRPLVVYGLLLSDRDGGRRWRRVGVREGGYALSVWTGLWLRVLDEVVRVDAMSEEQACKTLDMNHAGRTHWGSKLLDKVLTQYGELPQHVPPAEMSHINGWVRRIFPGQVFLARLLDDVERLTARTGQPVRLIEADEAATAEDRAEARDLRRRTAWWRDRVLATPWYAHFYVETVRFYDIYNVCDDWVAVHCAFSPIEQLLEVIDLPSAPPLFFRAATYDALVEQITVLPLDLSGYAAAGAADFVLPDQWRRNPEVAPSGRPSGFAGLEGRRHGMIWRESNFAHPAFEALARSFGQASSASEEPPPVPLVEAAAVQRLEPGRLIDIAAEEAEPFLADGFSYPIHGLRWTDSLLATLRFGHERRAAAAELTLWVQAVWRRGDTPARFDLVVDGAIRSTETLEPGRPLQIAFTPEEMAAGDAKSVALRPLDAKRPDDAPTSDHRRLGCALLAMRFTWAEA